MDERIIVAGSGGQGVLTLGVFLARIGVHEGRTVTWLPTYGAEKRGGFSFCYACVSDSFVYSPVVDTPTAFIAFDNRAYEMYRNKVTEKTLVVENSSLVQGGRDAGRRVSIPAAEISNGMKFIRGMNILLAGAFIESSGIFRHESAYDVMEEMLKGRNAEIIEKNFIAYGMGVKYVKDRSVLANINEGIKSVKEMFAKWKK
ncbi:MAG TPA: 2-oxoacid:acceptor oxidoreductase family protein [Candidatus Goldiibacteriota bacterium]|nr:2-oxoacid:acceptor oxidoreductase family protein [Candidatus Goldiibacteriota bacterium]